ncbi:MAG TPA: hypothetical protein PK055_04460 [Gammaproteobacteria bacterium]|nr:hypothetical protein [Xanthomonadales bacterium]HPI95705.1 hypothetical protein [Gammaproteobacteria bacterium]HPQ86892.1 hypothetical protein [Gammaproteobacteria bacterium]
MKKNKLSLAIALGMSLALASCGGDEKNAQQTSTENTVAQKVTQAQTKSNVLSYIPADTAILAIYVKDDRYPLPQRLVEITEKVYASVGTLLTEMFTDSFKKYHDKADPGSDTEKVDAFFDKWFSQDGIKKLGLSIEENEFALYAVDLFPVLRMTLAKGHSFDELLTELMHKANDSKADTAEFKSINGRMVYFFGDKEMKILVSLDGNELVVSLSPTREIDNLMPKLLGFEKPAKNITQSNEYHDTIAKYNYMGNSMYWFDIRQIADYFINPAQYNSPMLDLMKVQDKQMSQECKSEILGMFDKLPRMVGGTTKLSDTMLSSNLVFEMADGLGSKLSKMTGRIPASSSPSSLSYGFSFDIEAAKTLALEFVTNIEQDPYKCDMLQSLNDQAAGLKAQLSQPLPPFVSNFKGFNLIIDTLDLDFTQTDPDKMIKDLKAKVLLAVDNPEAIKGMATMALPELNNLGLNVGGEAVNISSMMPVSGTQIPVNLDHVFMAMGKETIGASLGEGTDKVLTQDVKEGGQASLFTIGINADFYQKMFAGIDTVSDKLPPDAQKQLRIQKTLMSDLIWWQREDASIGFNDKGLEISAEIKY